MNRFLLSTLDKKGRPHRYGFGLYDGIEMVPIAARGEIITDAAAAGTFPFRDIIGRDLAKAMRKAVGK